jgi:glyoxylase-like metal-dependent hydrolase (beta-lactamase superfamily II)
MRVIVAFKIFSIMAFACVACISLERVKAAEQGVNAATVVSQTTEEGQQVVFDGYTWQRRELAKRLPLSRPWPDEKVIETVFSEFGLDNLPIPEFIPTPSLIVPGVYLVGSNPNHTYLIDCGPAGTALIDPGLSSNYEGIIANIEQLGFSPDKIRWVLNTHAHFDHSMADGLFRKLGAEILIHAFDADAVERASRVTGSYFLPPEIQAIYPKTTVDWRLVDGEELKLGNQLIQVIHTPGHTEGSSTFVLQLEGQNILFTGDTLLYDHRLGFQGTAYADNHAYVRSLEKLNRFTMDAINRIQWDVLLPGHGALVLNRAYMDVQKGLRTVQIDLLEGYPVEALPFATDDYRRLMFGRPAVAESSK